MAEGQPTDDRHIQIQQDVLGSALVSGDCNKVFIYHYHLDQPIAPEPKPTTRLATNPYRGLAAFQVEDADVYFGREAQIDRLWNRLRDLHERVTQKHPAVRLLPILGPSGSGKSSLARAGLLPELARRSLPGHPQTRGAVMKPGTAPLEVLAVVLARIATRDPSPVEKAYEFERALKQRCDAGRYDGLRRIANALPGIDTFPLVILVDQFEEVYSLCQDPNQRTAFIEGLIEAAATPEARVSVVVTLRSDFLKETQQHPLLNQIIGSDQSAIVPAMTVDELHRTIAEPAKWAGHLLDEAVVDRLIEQTEGREGALPLLQFALTRIWEGLREGRSPNQTLNAIGGVGGALAGEAQRIYDSLDAKEKDIARRIFVGLVQLGEGTRDTRRRATVKHLIAVKDEVNNVRDVLNRFSRVGARLITLSSNNGDEIAEITHEALFAHWQQLTLWLDKCRDLIQQQRRIEAFAEEWKANGRKRSYLLAGRLLSETKRFYKKYTAQFPLSAYAVQFLNKSIQYQRISQLWLLLFFLIPTLVLDASLRELRVNSLLVEAESDNQARQRQAVIALTEGCIEKASVSWVPNSWIANYILDLLSRGNCRSLVSRNLRSANLRSANLSNALLNRANLSNALLSNTLLSGANLSGALLSDTDFSGALLSDANLSRTDSFSANFGHANLSNADLTYARIARANLNHSDLSNADLSNAFLFSTDLRDAINWTDDQLSKAQLCETQLPKGSQLDPNRDC